MGNMGTFAAPFETTLSQNPGLVTWAFNTSNQDGLFNNEFTFILAATALDPFGVGTKGYAIRGGGLSGNRLVLSRLDLGLGGSQAFIIDLASGLAPLPNQGSFRVTYDPASNLWSLYGESGATYVDPLTVNTLLGSGVDGTYTNGSTPYFGLNGRNTGSNFFDNVSIQVVPEPSHALLLLAGGAFVFCRRIVRRS